MNGWWWASLVLLIAQYGGIYLGARLGRAAVTETREADRG